MLDIHCISAHKALAIQALEKRALGNVPAAVEELLLFDQQRKELQLLADNTAAKLNQPPTTQSKFRLGRNPL